MGVTTYYSVGGEIIGERSGGVRTDYLRDALGSVTATKRTDRSTLSNTYRYKPYGERLAKTGGDPDPRFQYCHEYIVIGMIEPGGNSIPMHQQGGKPNLKCQAPCS